MEKVILGFSKKTKEEKLDWLISTHFHGDSNARALISSYWNSNTQLQQLHDDFIENTITNFYLPLGVAPNFLINQKRYTLPMAIEESSVVAAAAKSAKYWSERGGFTAEVLGQEKVGQIHFIYPGSSEKLLDFINRHKAAMIKGLSDLTHNMDKRGGGIQSLELRNKTDQLPNYYQLHLHFLTHDAMGANFINSCLEQLAKDFSERLKASETFSKTEKEIEIVMSILSNYVPNCLVKAAVRCPVEKLEQEEGLSKRDFAIKFIRAVDIARIEPHRAVTHNKGIMNGIDALVIATGNDFRAVEAGVHAYAARDGQYRSLSKAHLDGNDFCFEMTIPIAVGTVGGLTKLHPLVKWSLDLLGRPSAAELMQLIAVAGLSQNFAALRSLITSGIQKGHMKMHLLNILNQLKASASQKEAALVYFKTKTVTHRAVDQFLNKPL